MGDTLMEAYESYFRKPTTLLDKERPKSLKRYEWTEIQYITQQPPHSPIRNLSPVPIQRFQGQLSPYRAYSPQVMRTPPLSPMRQYSPNRFMNQFRSGSPIVPRAQPYQFVPIEQSVIDNLQNPYRSLVDSIPITQQERIHVGSRMAVPQVVPPPMLIQPQYHQPFQPVYQPLQQPQPVYQPPPALSQVVPLHYHPAISTPVFHSQVQPIMYQQQQPQHQQQHQFRHSEPPQNNNSIKRGRSPPTKQPFDFARILNKLIE